MSALSVLSLGLKAQNNSTKIDTNAIYTNVDVSPMPSNGLDGLYKYITDHIKYPAEDKAAHIEGFVVLQLIIERDGTVSNIKVLRAPSPSLSKEALRVISTTPKWIPGTLNGKKVRVQYIIPVKFVL